MSGNIFYRVKNSERIKSGSLKAVPKEVLYISSSLEIIGFDQPYFILKVY